MIDVITLKYDKDSNTQVVKHGQIENTLDGLRDIVGGWIEMPSISQKLSDNKISVIINEEGKLIDGLHPSMIATEIQDIIFGNVVFAGLSRSGDTISLTDNQIEIVEKLLCESSNLCSTARTS